MSEAAKRPPPTAPYRPPADEKGAPLYVDEHLLVVDKPAGLLSVPGRAPGAADCLIARWQARFADALIVHRLDMATSGLIVLARGAAAHRQLSGQFAAREVKKHYVAQVAGLVQTPAGEIDLPLICDWPNRPRQKVCHALGKPSLTRFTVDRLDLNSQTSWLDLEPVTGRSHQLRVHLASIGHPILGDTFYADAAAAAAPRLMLHASTLALTHPVHGGQLRFHSPAPF